MASSSSGYTNFSGKKLPKVSEVFEFISSRTSSAKGKTKFSHTEAVALMSESLRKIWVSADCAPKHVKHIKIQYESMYKAWKVLKNKSKPVELRKFENRVFDIVQSERYRKPGDTFDETFYNEQLTTYNLQMDKAIKPRV